MSRSGSVRQQRRVRVTLDVIAGPHKGARFEFDRHDTFLVGRGTWSHLCLSQDLHFSRHHFRIEIRPPECYLIDLGSRNGTFVNRKRMSEAYLREGDIISGGKTEILVGVSDDRSSTPKKAPIVDGSRGKVSRSSKTAVSTANPAPTVLGSLSGTATFVSQTSGRSSDRHPGIQEVPGYVLEEELGTGSMGVVYRATHKSTGQTVAIKLISQKQSTSEHAMQLFIREASLLGRLDHPHIVRSLDFGFANGQLFLVMEYVPTTCLDDILAEESRSSQIRIPCAIVSQVLKGLQHAHRLSVVHRDIKPENVLLCRKQRKLNAKLADFGLAKNYAYAGLSEISREGDIRGTIAYMPPELVVDCRNAMPAGDIYSAGATLYYYLSQSFPFEFGRRNKLAVILEDDPVPLKKRASHVPTALAEIVHRALSKEPRDRFPSASEMDSALKPFTMRRRNRR